MEHTFCVAQQFYYGYTNCRAKSKRMRLGRIIMIINVGLLGLTSHRLQFSRLSLSLLPSSRFGLADVETYKRRFTDIYIHTMATMTVILQIDQIIQIFCLLAFSVFSVASFEKWHHPIVGFGISIVRSNSE